MRALGAFLAALAVAVAVAVILKFLPMAANFESATDFGLARKVFDFLLTTGLIYLLLASIVAGFTALPFAMTFWVLKRVLPSTIAAVIAGLICAVFGLLPLAELSQVFDGDESPSAAFRAALPNTAVCGLVGGSVFAFLNRRPRASRP